MCATLREEARGLTAPYASEGAPFQPDGLFPEVSVPLAEYIVARAMLARACGKAALDVRAAGLAAGWPLRAGPGPFGGRGGGAPRPPRRGAPPPPRPRGAGGGGRRPRGAGGGPARAPAPPPAGPPPPPPRPQKGQGPR